MTIRGSARQRQRRHRRIRIGEFGDIRRLIINSLAVVVLDLLDAHCWRAHIGRNRHGYRVFRQGIVQAGNGVGGLGFLHRVGVGAIGLVYDLAEARLVICGIRADRDGIWIRQWSVLGWVRAGNGEVEGVIFLPFTTADALGHLDRTFSQRQLLVSVGDGNVPCLHIVSHIRVGIGFPQLVGSDCHVLALVRSFVAFNSLFDHLIRVTGS